MKLLRYLLIFIPISFFGEWRPISPTLMFIFSALAIIPLAGLMGEATEEISFTWLKPRLPARLSAIFYWS